jgi:hypothetical protein
LVPIIILDTDTPPTVVLGKDSIDGSSLVYVSNERHVHRLHFTRITARDSLKLETAMLVAEVAENTEGRKEQ